MMNQRLVELSSSPNGQVKARKTPRPSSPQTLLRRKATNHQRKCKVSQTPTRWTAPAKRNREFPQTQIKSCRPSLMRQPRPQLLRRSFIDPKEMSTPRPMPDLNFFVKASSQQLGTPGGISPRTGELASSSAATPRETLGG